MDDFVLRGITCLVCAVRSSARLVPAMRLPNKHPLTVLLTGTETHTLGVKLCYDAAIPGTLIRQAFCMTITTEASTHGDT